jgi:putative ABC transport system permease protein
VTHDDDRTPAWRRYMRFLRPEPTHDVDEELDFHLQSTIDELVAAGMPREAAHDAARRKFGDVDSIGRTLYTLSRQREKTMQRSEWWQTIKQDVVFGLRQLRKAPGFTVAALATLALGIGANSAIFSVVYSVMLKPLPFANSGRIITISETTNGANANAATFGNYASWRDNAHTLEAIAAQWLGGSRTLTGRGDPAPVPTLSTTAGWWKVQFIPPVAGHYYGADDERIGAPPVAVISYRLWQNRFNGDRSILGKQITLNATDYTIVGVAPAAYSIAVPDEMVWLPLKIEPARWQDHSDHELTVFALVKPDVSIEQATRELSAIERGLAKQYPNSGFDDVRVRTYADDVVGSDNRTLLFTLLGALGLVLLIACANVANLLIARGGTRRTEIAIRGALGASRGRIVSQLLVESLLLGLAGGVLGLAVAWAGVRFLVTSPVNMARLGDSTLNMPVIAFTFALAVACATVFGSFPALHAARLDLQQTLRDGGREGSAASRHRLRGLLVVGELCLAQVLLIGAVLLIRSAALVAAVPPGFSTDNLMIVNVGLPPARYGQPGALEAGFLRLDEAIAAVPGVRAVGRTSLAPVVGGQWWNCNAWRPGSNGHDDGAQVANMRSANNSYFPMMGTPMLRGRNFNNTDVANGPLVAIITSQLAHDLYGDKDPVGQLISSCIDGKPSAPAWRTVVGVVGDTRARGRRTEPPRELYMPSAQWQDNSTMAFLVRGAVPVTTLAPAIRRAVAGVDPLLALSGPPITMDAAFAKLQALPRFTMWLLILLGATGLALSIVGVYGVIAYFVSQRTHEFGVRMALGAPRPALLWMVVKEGIVLGVFGVAVGTVAAYGMTKFLARLVFGITTHDPMTYGAVAAGLALVAGAASYLPAIRATKVDPVEAIRA